MKIHITNLYNFNPNDELVLSQHAFADAGRELNFTEMGIFSFPVETDSYAELSKRLDGILAAMEQNDMVFMQLPTQNGFDYENLLFHKIRAYKNTKIILILHDLKIIANSSNSDLQKKYIELLKNADCIIIPSATAAGTLTSHGITNLLFCDNIHYANYATLNDNKLSQRNNSDFDRYISLCKTNFYYKKILMDAVESAIYTESKLAQDVIQAPNNEIQIGFGLHDKYGNYSVWVGTAMQSIIDHTNSKLCFHILHDSTLNENNKKKLYQTAFNYGHRIIFHLIDEALFSAISEQTGIFTIGAMFRVMLPELLPDLSKIIYLDADILVNRDIKELWDMNIENHYFAAVPDMGVSRNEGAPIPVRYNQISASCYINSGVLYLNLSAIKQKGNMKDDVLNYLKQTTESRLPDQDALNVLYGDKILFLDESWNYFAIYVRKEKEIKLENKIYHFAGTQLALYSLTEMDQLYYETILRTPWGKEVGSKILSQALERSVDRITQLEKVLHILMHTNKKKIFYGPENHIMKNIYNLLSISDKDYRILMSPDINNNCILPCKNFSSLKKEPKDSFVVFVLPMADNETALSNLEELGLENSVDYFVIHRLLPPEQGGYL